MQVDNTFNRLQTLCEYIDDTEVGGGRERGKKWGKKGWFYLNCARFFQPTPPRPPPLPRHQDYINIELDNHRNQLIRLDLMLTAATFATGIVAAVSSIFGMNLHNKNEDSYGVFVATAVGASGGALLLFGLIVAFCKHKGLF